MYSLLAYKSLHCLVLNVHYLLLVYPLAESYTSMQVCYVRFLGIKQNADVFRVL